MKINVTRSSLPPFDEYVNEIKCLWDTRWLTNMGEKHQLLQERIQKFTGAKNVILYTNGHLALESAIEVYNFPKGSEIITTPFTFASTTNAIVRKGCTPVFCDIEDQFYTIDPSKIEKLITSKTVAIIAVHVYGHMCDVDKIEKIAKKHNLVVIYDAAHAFGVTYKGVSSACFGDISMFSFHATKVFNTIEGGALCFKNDELVSVLTDNKNFGIHNQNEYVFPGGNAKMNEFQAAMGICNLRHLSEEIAKRKKCVDRYHKRLSNIKGIKICSEQQCVKSNYSYFPIVFDGYKWSRDEVYSRLYENNIIARKYFFPLTNSFECYKSLPTAGVEKTPIAKNIADKVLTLPLYADLTIEMVDLICDIILR